ncbi:MAG: hypothetical protein MR400_08180 [Clostridiales bacterium]|nr:hypothetical protein [Clostridiales bacterium]
MTHEDSLRENGYTVCSPISGSMLPSIRPHVDSVIFVPPQRVRRYDVALYRVNGQAIMHRVIALRGDVCLIRGDNSARAEEIPLRDVFGVMRGFYRGKRYVAASSPGYRLFARCWVALHPLLPVVKRVYGRLRRLRGRLRR